MPELTIALLGGFRVQLGSGQALVLPTKKMRALCAYVGLRPGQAYSRDHLAALLWGDTPDEQARKSLRQSVYMLRKTLPSSEPPSVLLEGETIALNPAAVQVDVSIFERLAVEEHAEALERAAALYHGDLLEGFSVNEAPFEEWLASERERLHELALEVLVKILAHQSRAGQPERAIQTAARLLALDPSQEAVHRALMRLYASQGRRGAALKQYRVCVTALKRELGTEPEPETTRLYQDILQPRLSETPKNSAEPIRPRPTPRPEPFTREAALIGRGSELAQLREALGEASRARGSIIAIVGEAGIGKTRLLEAFAVEAQARGVRILLGRSYHTEQVLAFGPWVEALRTARVIADAEVLDGLSPIYRWELARLLPELGGPEAERANRPPDRRRLFEAATELLRGLAAKEPVLIMFEDVHWADETSLRLVAFLARRIAASRVVIAVTMREEELGAAPVLRHVVDELSRERHFLHVPLAPLTRAETKALVQSLTRAAFSSLVLAELDEQAWRVSEGNPFVVVETIRAIQEGAPPDTREAVPVSEKVRRLVSERLERLSDRGRFLASLAAVIGREFDFALLQHAAKLDPRKAAEGVEELVRSWVLRDTGERLDFTHERIRDVAYNQLLQPSRQVLHVQVANALEILYASRLEPHYARLARHYHEGRAWEKALSYFRQAGTRAIQLSAYREAVACFEAALAVLPNLPETRETSEAAIDLRLDLRHCLLPLAEFAKIRTYLDEADTFARTLGDPRRLGWLCVYRSHYLRTTGHSREALEFAHITYDLCQALDDSRLRLGADLFVCAAHFSLGDYRRATESSRRIVQSVGSDLKRRSPAEAGSPAVIARAYLAHSLAELGQFEEGIAWGEEGVRLAEALDQPMSLAYACLRLAYLHALKGELDRAAVLLERARGLTRDRGITFTAAIVTGDLGHVYALQGRFAEGVSLLRDAMDAYESMRVEVVRARLLVHLGEAYRLAGRLEEAHACAEQSLSHARARGERGYEAYALRLLGELASDRDRRPLEAAEGHYREALTLAGELEMRPLVARCHRGLGTLYLRAGKTHAAREQLAAAARMFRQMNMESCLGRADAELAASR